MASAGLGTRGYRPCDRPRRAAVGCPRGAGEMLSDLFQFSAAFLASSVEMVEALTIVLAVGVTRSWRPALMGVGGGLVALAVVVGALGPSLVVYVPIDTLRVVIGSLLLVFGLQWLRK